MARSQTQDSNRPPTRKLRPEDIALPPEYRIDVFAEGLTTPINMTFTDEGEILIKRRWDNLR